MPDTYACAAGLNKADGIGVPAGRINEPVQLFSPSAGRLIQTGIGKTPFLRFASGTVTMLAEVKRRSRRNSCEKKKKVRSTLSTQSFPSGFPSPKRKK